MCCFGFSEYLLFTCGHRTVSNKLRYIACANVPSPNKKVMVWARPAAMWETRMPCDDCGDRYDAPHQLAIVANTPCRVCRDERVRREKMEAAEAFASSLASPHYPSGNEEVFSERNGGESEASEVSDMDAEKIVNGRSRTPLPTQSEAYARFLAEAMRYLPNQSGRTPLPPQKWLAPVRRVSRLGVYRAATKVEKRGGSSWRRGDPY